MAKPPVQGFISYTRIDNESFGGIVDRLKKELEGKFLAQTGRKLELFLDRESIGWGQDWRNRINDSVKSAVVFIPIVSQAFFQSDPCREELLAFSATAEDLGVTDLILPIVIAGADRITVDHDIEEVRLIERLNYKNVEQAYLSGYESKDWRQNLHDMVSSLDERLSAAESTLEEREASSLVISARTTGEVGEYDLFSFTDDLDGITQSAQAAMVELTTLGESVAQSGIDLNSGTPTQKRANLALLASRITDNAKRLEITGRDLERRVTALDPQLREVLQTMSSVDQLSEQRATITASLRGMVDLDEASLSLEGVLQILQMVSVVSVSMKKALAPAINGIRSIRGAFNVVDSWRNA